MTTNDICKDILGKLLLLQEQTEQMNRDINTLFDILIRTNVDIPIFGNVMKVKKNIVKAEDEIHNIMIQIKKYTRESKISNGEAGRVSVNSVS